MVMRFPLLLCILSLIFPFAIHANALDGIYFSHLGLVDGLSHSSVFAIGQDREGKLWFATYDGVNKYDGYKFTVYRHQYTDSHSLGNDITRCLVVDDADRVWVGTREGLSLYNRSKDTFSNYSYKKEGKDISVIGICPISRDLLMLVTGEDILFFDISRAAFIDSPLFQSANLSVPSVLERFGDDVYIGTENGVYVYSIPKNILNKFVDIPTGVRVQAILCQSGRIWMGTEGDGLYSYDTKLRVMKHYLHAERSKTGLNSDYVRSLELDADGRLWIGTYGGLNIYQEDADSFLSIESSEMGDGGLSQNSVRSIFRDSQGGMWLGTYWGGINYYHPLCNQFRCLRHIPFINSLSDNVVSCMVEDGSGNLWIGTSNGGLNFYDRASRQFRNYPFKSEKKGWDMPFKDIKTVYVDEANSDIYVGAHAGGMMIFHRKTGQMEYYNRSNSSMISNNIYSILSDNHGGLLLASLDGLMRYDKKKHRFAVIETDQYGEKIQQSNTILFRDSKRRIWLGGKKGITVCNLVGGLLVVDKEYSHWSPSLSDAFVNCFHESASGYMWIGTRNGLFALQNKGNCRQYTVADGLPSNVIYGILEDSNGNLWISTNQGLSFLSLKSGKFRNFTISDGLQSNQFNAGSYCRLSDGKMLFGGINGITLFHPETLIDNPYVPKPSINKLFVFNKEVLPDDGTGILKESIETIDHITLTSSQNSFAISFVVSNFVSGRHNTFAYKLDGYDKTWYKQEDITPVSYSNLPAGEYTFYVKAANNDGKWNEEPAILHIRILPVWYCSWWFIGILFLIVLLLLWGVIHYFRLRSSMQAEIAKERLDKELHEEMNEMKISFYVNISHELRTPLTLIVAPLQELLLRMKGHWEHEQLLYIKRNTTRLLHLVNQLMDYRRAELGIFELYPVYANAYKRVMNVFVNYESLAKRKDIDYNFCSDLQEENELFDENYLDLITNNLLSNAFKYTEPGESIMVRLYKEDTSLVLQVTDTGIGIPREKQKKVFERFYQMESGCEGSGIGLSLVQRLVELHHGKITLQSEVGKGSVFTVYLPQEESAYTQEELLNGESGSAEQRSYSTNAHDAYVGDEGSVKLEGVAFSDENKRGTILIAEDNEELRRYIVQGLSELRFSLLEAENGQKAMNILKETDVDLIIMDVMMPVMDGIKLCKFVKQNLRTSHIPVYMLSAKADVKYQLRGLQVGADDYIPKPFSMEVLKTKIQNTFRMRYRMLEHYSNTLEIEPEKLTSNAVDEEFLRKAMEVVEKNMGNVEFSTELFAREMNMSRSGLHLKLKSITGKSAIDFIHKIRFNRACQLLKEGKHTVAEISFMVGYNTPSYFATRFKKYVGCLPTEYVKRETE